MANPSPELASEEELAKIAEIRGKLEPELTKRKEAGTDFPHITGDIFFVRLLRGNDSNVEQAVEWYKRAEGIRESFKLDDVCRQITASGKPWHPASAPYWDEVNQYTNVYFDEEKLKSKSGHLIWFDAVGSFRPKEAIESLNLDHFRAWNAWSMEQRNMVLDRMSREQGRLIRIVRVMDLEGSGLWMLRKDYSDYERDNLTPVAEGASIEVTQSVFMINFRSFFMRIWELVKKTMPVNTANKFRVLGKDFMQNQEYLYEVGVDVHKALVAVNRYYVEGVANDEGNMEGTMECIWAGRAMERSVEVEPGQKIFWTYKVGKAFDAKSDRGMLSRLATRYIAGSDITFSVYAIYVDQDPTEIKKIPVKVRSAAAGAGEAAEFWVNGKPVEFTAGEGVNVVALDRQTQTVVLGKTYDLAADSGGANAQLIADLEKLPKTTMVLVAVKTDGAAPLSEEAWDALRAWGATQTSVPSKTGYAFIGTKGGLTTVEKKGRDVEVEVEVPAIDMWEELVSLQKVTEEDGEQSGLASVDRRGLIMVRWGNLHSYISSKTIAEYKVWSDADEGAGPRSDGLD